MFSNKIPSSTHYDANNNLETNSDTTAATLAWIAYELCKQPKIQAKLRKQIDAIAPASKSHLDVDDVANCAFLDDVINEALRLHPAVCAPQ
jgi:cytochrome P450